jgi:hypothetical protein
MKKILTLAYIILLVTFGPVFAFVIFYPLFVPKAIEWRTPSTYSVSLLYLYFEEYYEFSMGIPMSEVLPKKYTISLAVLWRILRI